MRKLAIVLAAITFAPLACADEDWRGLKWHGVTLSQFKLGAAANNYDPEKLIEIMKGDVFSKSHRGRYINVIDVKRPENTALFCVFFGEGRSTMGTGVYFVMNTAAQTSWTSNFCRY